MALQKVGTIGKLHLSALLVCIQKTEDNKAMNSKRLLQNVTDQITASARVARCVSKRESRTSHRYIGGIFRLAENASSSQVVPPRELCTVADLRGLCLKRSAGTRNNSLRLHGKRHARQAGRMHIARQRRVFC